MCGYESAVFLRVLTATATRADVYELSLFKDFKAGKNLDVDFMGLNCSIATPGHKKLFIGLVGTKLTTHPAYQAVKDHGDDGKEWLQYAAFPWIIRQDMRGVPVAEIEDHKEKVCRFLRDLGHSCIPSLNVDVRIRICVMKLL